MIIEVVGVGFSVFALSRVVLRFREGRMSWGMMAVWSLAWLSVIAFVLSPARFEVVSKAIGIQRPLDLMLIVGLVLAYYLLFRMYVYIEELRADMAKAVREMALAEVKGKGKK
jgi:hypothetical protein